MSLNLRIYRVQLPDSESLNKFVFLCGANKSPVEISERRKSIIDFARKQLPNTKVLLAEDMFKTLTTEGHKGNILDVEDLISKFSDFILIVLESPSAFAELGAFANPQLRDKLIVINDEQFKQSQSFINLGPIAAVRESGGASRILHYKMHPNGIHEKDAIGDIYPNLYKLLSSSSEQLKKTTNNIDSFDPSMHFDKTSVLFIHDLIYITGPITYKELIEEIKLIFGSKKKYNNVLHIIAVLKAFGSISKDEYGTYRSTFKSFYLTYRFDINKIIATFRNHTMKYHAGRLCEFKKKNL